MTRLGLFGGTFDPIHVGHLAVASAAVHGLHLDEIWFVVAHRPWQKVGTRRISDSGLRLAMVQAATADRDDLVASSIEIDRGGSSYTVDTVEQLRGERPDDDLVLVVGSDVVTDLNTWHRHDELATMVSLGIVDRPGDVGAEPPPGWRFERIAAPLVDLSSSMLRARMAAGEPVDYLVPRAALDIYERWHEDRPAVEESSP